MFKELCWSFRNPIIGQWLGVRYSRSNICWEYGSTLRIYVQRRSPCIAESSGKFSQSCRKSTSKKKRFYIILRDKFIHKKISLGKRLNNWTRSLYDKFNSLPSWCTCCWASSTTSAKQLFQLGSNHKEWH